MSTALQRVVSTTPRGRLLSVRRGEWLRDDALREWVKRHQVGSACEREGEREVLSGDKRTGRWWGLGHITNPHTQIFPPQNPPTATIALTAWQAVGIVYGDIGTSPTYTLQSILREYKTPPPDAAILGSVSAMFWVLTALLLAKYTFIVLRADDGGEGGTFALYSLLRRAGVAPGARDAAARAAGGSTATPSGGGSTAAAALRACAARMWPTPSLQPVAEAPAAWRAAAKLAPTDAGAAAPSPPTPDWRARVIASPALQATLSVLVVAGVGAVLGDGVLTPAISVLSAAEGLALPLPSFAVGSPPVVGLAAAILVALFAVQRAGSGGMSILFSPVSVLYFLTIGGVGAFALAARGANGARALSAVSPHHMVRHIRADPFLAWRQLGSIALTVTGAEALYADLG